MPFSLAKRGIQPDDEPRRFLGEQGDAIQQLRLATLPDQQRKDDGE